MRRLLLALLFVATAAATTATATPARAHEGPPYPAIVDRAVGPYVLSVWTDPDVGIGTFFVIFEPPALGSETDPRVSIEVWPSTGRLPPVRHDTHRQRDHAYKAEVPFDQEELWTVKVRVEGSRGSAETVFEVPVTPPGYGAWDLLIYFTPFLALGVLWVAVSIKRRRMASGVE